MIVEELTDREREILQLLAEGQTNRQIARTLVISVGTVKWHNNQIFGKLGVGNRTEAVAVARAEGLLREGKAIRQPDDGALFVSPEIVRQTEPLYGREGELRQIADRLVDDDVRLVTLVGAGGAGKTSLAIAVAQHVKDSFPDGVYFVPLATIAAAEHFASLLVKVLSIDVNEKSDVLEQVKAYVADRKLLLLLDNFDHILPAGMYVSELIDSAPDIRMLVTSRERLNLTQEQLFTVNGLPVGDGSTEAELSQSAGIQLFVERARLVQPDFSLNTENVAIIRDICRLVDGMPLGIVLAAAWMKLLTPADILSEMQRSFDFLSSNMRNIPERHRSVRSIFDASWNMLTEDERHSFMQMAVFRGSFSRDAAQQVSGAPLRVLLQLTNKSLLQSNHQGRFLVHELLRSYAMEKLQESDLLHQAQDAHCKYYLNALQNRADLHPDDDFENLRQAWYCAISSGQADRVAAALPHLYDLCVTSNHYQDALQCLNRAVEFGESNPDVFGESLMMRLRDYRGRLYALFARFKAATTDLCEVQAYTQRIDDTEWERKVLIQLGSIYRRKEQSEDAIQHLTNVIESNRQRGDLRSVADATYHLGTIYWDMGLNQRALELYEMAADISEELRLDDIVMVQALHGLGEGLWIAGYPERAVESYLKSAQYARDMEDRFYEVENLLMAGWALLGQYGTGDYDRATGYFDQALAMSESGSFDFHRMCGTIGAGISEFSVGGYVAGFEQLLMGIELALALNSRRMLAVAYNGVGRIFLEMEEFDIAETFFQRGIDALAQLESLFWLPVLQANYALVRLRQGYTDVIDQLQEALATCETHDLTLYRLSVLDAMVESVFVAGDYTLAKGYIDEMQDISSRQGLQEWQLKVLYWQGRLAYTEGDPDRACDLLLQAHERATSVLLRREIARRLLELGATSAGNGNLADIEAEYQRLNRQLDEAQQQLVPRVEALLLPET